MRNQSKEQDEAANWSMLVAAATRAMEANGFVLERVPGRGRSNIWNVRKDGKTQRVSVRTTKDRWFAFPPLEGGRKWKTLDDVDSVIVAAVDDREDPRNVEVYWFSADEVRKRFDSSYKARKNAGQTLKDNFGMWVRLDIDERELPSSVGSGLAAEQTPIANYSITELAGKEGTEGRVQPAPPTPRTIAEVMDWARQHIASLSGVRVEAVKLDCKIES